MNDETAAGTGAGGITEDAVYDALRGVIDPEVGIDIVNLGLVYGVEINGSDVSVTMTMTTSACPLHGYITEQAKEAIERDVPGAGSVEVEMVWDPPWDPEMMSAEAREALGR